MSQASAAPLRRERIDLGVDLRKTSAGEVRHGVSADHYVTIHSGTPVRISCMPRSTRCVRSHGEINVLPAGSTDDWFEDDAGSIVEIRLPAAIVRLAAEEMGLDPARDGIAPRCHARDPHIEHIAWALAADRREGEPNGTIFRESLGMALAVHLLREQVARAPSPRTARLSAEQVAVMTEYIEAHIAEDLSLARIARVVGISASHLRALFKRTLGMAVHEYVVRRRVERARAMLASGDIPAGRVALETGFSHQSHLARWIRRVHGVTPTAIMRSRR